MEETVGAVAAVATVGLILTKIVDMLRNMIDADGTKPKWLWNVISLALGVGAAFIWGLDATGLATDTEIQAWAGQLLTGLALGATASGWHEVLDNISAGATAKRTASTATVTAQPGAAASVEVVGGEVLTPAE